MLGDAKLESRALVQADVNADGKVDIADLATLKQYIMKDPITLGPKKNKN